ncbi:energy transducer TonB family protein [Leptospira bandrabouensis]|uniref:energy transducer TonB family protein n=1 Tax=Leptospira bandrabouensis TaxID=2484903 RepID=UPI001EE8548F|nr:energy transducer TonB [Leptospira bandrabouensis]MCG6143139.1 energy transducer TonB [Leptospira bandrabouensis]MCG6158799.1 energy transducer TonB [Leptospira bandrabouensis]MCG6162734.1 energy transducer TonB [Leptospira bandrabouensis]
MDSANVKSLSPWAKKSLTFFLWMSPLFSLGPFLALGVLFAFPGEFRLRLRAIAVVAVYILSWVIFYPIELLHRSGLEWEALINEFLAKDSRSLQLKFGFVLLCFILLLTNYFHSRKRNHKRESIRSARLQTINPYDTIRTDMRIRDAKFDTVLLVLFLALLLNFGFQVLSEKLHPNKSLSPLAPLVDVYQFVFNYSISLCILLLNFNRNKIPSLVAKPYLRYMEGIRIRERWKKAVVSQTKFPFRLELVVKEKAKFRDRILPGFGHVYVYEYWRGFPILFLTLLLFLFSAVWVFSYVSPIFGIQFLAGFGLKPGVPDKDFFISSQNIAYAVFSVSALVGIYFYSSYLLEKSFSLENLGVKEDKIGDSEPFFKPGLRKGFRNILPLSLLFHLVLICLVFLIPITLQRNKKKDQSSQKNNHFQPEKMEFYFIDPNVPDDTKGLNGGIVTGNETENKEKGEKISNEKVADSGPVKGYIKKIRGKKVPPTYSNYISAKMRIPESYMDYWAKAPHPYSSVVAYTITQDGDVIDVELVEASEYPDQDLRTLQLVESLGPLMPPPGTKNDIRVTELFWNGPIDPEFVPTPLQKEMINLFDGRYMEELSE